MRVFDYLQGEIRDIKEINILSNGEHELIYNKNIERKDKKYENFKKEIWVLKKSIP